MIRRGPRPDGGFVVIYNDTIRDQRLSLRARGLLALLLSYPDDWRVNSVALARTVKEGRDAVRTALKELESAGYLVREKHQDETGVWRTDSVVYDVPVPRPAGDGNPGPGSGNLGAATAGNPPASDSGKPASPSSGKSDTSPGQGHENGGKPVQATGGKPATGPRGQAPNSGRKPALDSGGKSATGAGNLGPDRSTNTSPPNDLRSLPPHGPGDPKPRRGTRLPEPFDVTPEMLEWVRAECPGLPKSEHEKFCDHWRAQPGQRGVKLDWTATWRNWMRRAHEQLPGRPRSPTSRESERERRRQAWDWNVAASEAELRGMVTDGSH